MGVFYLDHERLGRVIVHTRANSSGVSVRWRDGLPLAVVPQGISSDTLRSMLSRMADRILERRPRGREFFEGRVIAVEGLTVTLLRQSVKSHSILFRRGEETVDILVGDAIEWADTRFISQALRHIASEEAARILLPRAAALAAQKGMHPRKITISQGRTVLGTCSRAGVIALSSRCVWLTPELRDYIVCHELAHLVHHDHSPAFHALCDALTGGREKLLEAALKSHPWPF